MTPLHSLFARSLVRYLFTGGVGFAAELLVIWALTRVWGADPVLAVGVSFWVGLLLTFVMQKVFTFRDTQRSAARLTRQTLLFAALVLVNYLFTLLFVAIVDPVIHFPELSRALALVVTTVWNYFAYKHVIFRRP